MTDGVSSNPTLSQIAQRFSGDAKGRHLRLNIDKSQLYCHDRFHMSSSGIRKLFGNKDGVYLRRAERREAARMLKNMIDKEFGRGRGDEVFHSLNIKENKGVKVGDLESINKELERPPQRIIRNAFDEVARQRGLATRLGGWTDEHKSQVEDRIRREFSNLGPEASEKDLKLTADAILLEELREPL